MVEATPTFKIEILPQGICIGSASVEEVSRWVDENLNLLREFEPIRNSQLTLLNSNFGSSQLPKQLQAEYAELKKLLVDPSNQIEIQKQIDVICGPARIFQRVLAGTDIANHVLRVAQQNLPAAHLLLLVYSNDYFSIHQAAQGQVEVFRAALMSPLHLFGRNIVTAETAAKLTVMAQAKIENEYVEIKKYLNDCTQEIELLKRTYKDLLSLQEPAAHWGEVVRNRTKQWRFWLGAFVAMLLGPFVFAFIFSEKTIAVADYLLNSQHNIAGGIALVSAPILLFAWLLRQTSRVFIKAFDLSVDAAHRKALATTFLGLAANKDVAINSSDKVIILQALFRQQPSNSVEEGPPTSLVELVRGNSQ